MMHATHPLATGLTDELEQQLARHFAQHTLTLEHGAQAVRIIGQGTAIVLLHGIGSGAASWLQVALQLGAHAKVVAWDAPGYGDSAPLPQAQPKAEDYARRLGQTLDALEIDQCVLVGHSLGALTAAAFARAQPSRVARVVLISPARGYGACEHALQRSQVRHRRLQALEQLGIAQMAEQRSTYMLSPRPSAQALAWVRGNMSRLNPGGYRQAVELLCDDDLLRHGPLSMPCEVHCGEADSITAPQDCLSLAKALCAPFNLIPDAGHASPIEQPLLVAGRLAHALQQTQTGTAQ